VVGIGQSGATSRCDLTDGNVQPHTRQSGGSPSGVTRELAVTELAVGAPNSPSGGTGLSGEPSDCLLCTGRRSVSGFTSIMSWTLLDTC
jgi:hypothetical protein